MAADAIRNALKSCDTKANDDEIAGMARHTESAMNEVSLAAGLRDKAASCEQGPCSSITAGIRPMMEAGQMDNAKSKIDQARAKGCNVKDLDQQFEVYKYIRDAAAAIHQLVSQCRFDEAISFGKKIPEQYHTTLTEDQLALARIGQKKVADVNQLLSEAKAAAARGDQSTASQRIQAAERQASYDGRWYACVEPSIQAAAGVSPTAPTSPVGPGTQPGSTALSAKVEVKQPYQSGSWKYSYSASGGRITYAAADGQINVSSDFAGVPGSLTPGTEFTVTVSGNHSSSPPTAGANVNVTASVEASGLETVSAQSANFKAGGVRPGKYVFRVPSNATSVTLTLHGDFGLGDIATYRYSR